MRVRYVGEVHHRRGPPTPTMRVHVQASACPDKSATLYLFFSSFHVTMFLYFYVCRPLPSYLSPSLSLSLSLHAVHFPFLVHT
mmetsp:Transcript_47167/g.121897  ORF Transcript_47167/g.121897 Transcript_47167/m.121897 type:complete len:83 (-) Transcript_47167:403-651(-)